MLLSGLMIDIFELEQKKVFSSQTPTEFLVQFKKHFLGRKKTLSRYVCAVTSRGAKETNNLRLPTKNELQSFELWSWKSESENEMFMDFVWVAAREAIGSLM